jgi:hypothetical protein
MTRHDHTLCFSAFISRPISLLASKRVSLFSFIVFTLSPSKLVSSAYTVADVSQSIPNQLFLDFLDGIF